MSNNKNKVVPYAGTDPELIEEFINEIKDYIKPKGIIENYVMENITLHEYFFRTKLYNKKLTKDQLDKLLDLFKWSLGCGGETVGIKAALCISEALTQANLKAIHGMSSGSSTDKVIRTAGIDRFQEILSGNKPKHTIITIKLYNDDKSSSEDFANEQETFYLKSLITDMSLVICESLEKEISDLHPQLELDKLSINYWYITVVWDISVISSFNIHVCDIIDALMANYDEILFITGYVLNKYQFKAYIYFKPTVKQEQINVIMEEWNQERASTIVRGGYLERCYVSENKNNPGHYIIEANEINERSMALENLIYDPRVDPYGCRTSNMEVTYKLFGVNETAARIHEELLYTATNLSGTKDVLSRHYKVLADSMLSNGEFRYATRGSLKSDETMDPLKLIAFETASDFIKSSLKSNKYMPVADGVSASYFGELPNYGTGISKITLYHT